MSSLVVPLLNLRPRLCPLLGFTKSFCDTPKVRAIGESLVTRFRPSVATAHLPHSPTCTAAGELSRYWRHLRGAIRFATRCRRASEPDLRPQISLFRVSFA